MGNSKKGKKFLHVLDEKSVALTGRLSAAEYADMEYIGKRLKVSNNRHGTVNITQVIREMIARTKKELQEPTIKFPVDEEF